MSLIKLYENTNFKKKDSPVTNWKGQVYYVRVDREEVTYYKIV